jgi:nuclear protein localization family protein 4
MLIRVRSNVGVWRVTVSDTGSATVSNVLDAIAQSRPHVEYQTPLSKDPACQIPLDESMSLSQQGISHGDMIYCRVDPSSTIDVVVTSTDQATAAVSETTAATDAITKNQHMRKVIDKDGVIKLVPTNEVPDGPDRGFRKGLLPLRDMKMHWTCTFVSTKE